MVYRILRPSLGQITSH